MITLTINTGSSSLKSCVFLPNGSRLSFHYDHIHQENDGYRQAFERLLCDLHAVLGDQQPAIVGHRFVHGGNLAEPFRLVDGAERARLESLTYLAPLHMPANLTGLDLSLKHFCAPQLACFDTAFHATMPQLSTQLPIPNELGLRRYGFHGLSYAHIAQALPDLLGETAYKKIVVAHLGNGSSLCLMENLKSQDTTMGYTPAGGVPMATRSGDIDPGVMLELAKSHSIDQLNELVYRKMGLLALSDGQSEDMQTLLSSNSNQAKFAVDYYCQQIRGAIGALAGKAGGIDALVFTGGIGEHATIIREKICKPLSFLNIKLDSQCNQSNFTRIEQNGCKPILVIPADEESMIQTLCIEHLKRTTAAR